MLTEQIKQKAAEYAEYLTEFRRDLHRHPELSMQERRTAQKIEEALKQIPGMEVQAGLVGGVGVVGLLRGKKGPGKTVLLRADIDALPIQETTGLPFCSQNEGVMHACGHDGHTAWLLGAAKILADLQEEFCGCVKFVFQPGEEGGGGGRKMVQEENVLENPKADAVFAAHAWPEIPAGQVHVARRCGFGYPGSFAIQVIGRGGHGSWPSQCVDPIAVANQIYGGLQQIISRRLPETAARALSVCTIHSGPQDKSNIIPDCCTMTGTIRTDSEPAMQQMIAQIQQVAQGVAQANDARAEVTARSIPRRLCPSVFRRRPRLWANKTRSSTTSPTWAARILPNTPAERRALMCSPALPPRKPRANLACTAAILCWRNLSCRKWRRYFPSLP